MALRQLLISGRRWKCILLLLADQRISSCGYVRKCVGVVVLSVFNTAVTLNLVVVIVDVVVAQLSITPVLYLLATSTSRCHHSQSSSSSLAKKTPDCVSVRMEEGGDGQCAISFEQNLTEKDECSIDILCKSVNQTSISNDMAAWVLFGLQSVEPFGGSNALATSASQLSRTKTDSQRNGWTGSSQRVLQSPNFGTPPEWETMGNPNPKR